MRIVAVGPASHSSDGSAPRTRAPSATHAGAAASRRGMHSRISCTFASGASRANSRARSCRDPTAASRSFCSVGAALVAVALICSDLFGAFIVRPSYNRPVEAA
jgi:hypothetical protein